MTVQCFSQVGSGSTNRNNSSARQSRTYRRSEMMRRIRAKNTKPERIVRSAAHRLGYRFRLHLKHLPGSQT